eukprot:2975604-Rhodomonas_salina.2
MHQVVYDAYPGLDPDVAFLAARKISVEVEKPRGLVDVSTKFLNCREEVLWPARARGAKPSSAAPATQRAHTHTEEGASAAEREQSRASTDDDDDDDGDGDDEDEDEDESITLVSVASIDRALASLHLAARWDGPLSYAFYARTEEEAAMLRKFVREDLGPYCSHRAHTLAVVLLSQCHEDGLSAATFPFPINKLRAAAVLAAPTDLV